MNLAFITEDGTDDAVLSLLLRRLGSPEHTSTRYLAGVGFGAVLKNAPSLVRQAARGLCRAAILSVDCDETANHFQVSHQTDDSNCRRCRLSNSLPPLHELRKLSAGAFEVVIAVPVRTIESWLAVLAGIQIPGSLSEFGKTRHERLELKRLVYGDATPTAEVMRTRAQQIGAAGDLQHLERASPSFADFREQSRGLR